MNISIKKLANKSLFNSLQRGFAASSISEVLTKQCHENKLKNAVRFENQAQTWTFQELDQHSDAFAQGLVELGYKPDDKVVFWFDRSHTSQVITAQVHLQSKFSLLIALYRSVLQRLVSQLFL